MGKLWEKYGENYREICEKVWDNCWGNDGIKVVPCVFFWGPKLLNSLGSVGKYYPTSLPSGELT